MVIIKGRNAQISPPYPPCLPPNGVLCDLLLRPYCIPSLLPEKVKTTKTMPCLLLDIPRESALFLPDYVSLSLAIKS